VADVAVGGARPRDRIKAGDDLEGVVALAPDAVRQWSARGGSGRRYERRKRCPARQVSLRWILEGRRGPAPDVAYRRVAGDSL
jgi:hypothetical protein